jgi:hypothetical protein
MSVESKRHEGMMLQRSVALRNQISAFSPAITTEI